MLISLQDLVGHANACCVLVNTLITLLNSNLLYPANIHAQASVFSGEEKVFPIRGVKNIFQFWGVIGGGKSS